MLWIRIFKYDPDPDPNLEENADPDITKLGEKHLLAVMFFFIFIMLPDTDLSPIQAPNILTCANPDPDPFK